MNDFLKTPIEFLKGVGPQRADLLRQELGIHTFADLLNHFPFRYIDRSRYVTVSELSTMETAAQLRGRIIAVSESGVGRTKKLSAKFQDESGIIDLIWFQGIRWIKPLLKIGIEYQLYGKAKFYGSSWNMPHPELTEWKDVLLKTGLQPVYSTTEKLTAKGLHSKGIEKLTATLVSQVKGKLAEDRFDLRIESN